MIDFVKDSEYPLIKSVDDVNIIKGYLKEIDASKMRKKAETTQQAEIKKTLNEQFGLEPNVIRLLTDWYENIGKNKKGEVLKNVERAEGLFDNIFHE